MNIIYVEAKVNRLRFVCGKKVNAETLSQLHKVMVFLS